MEGRLGRDPPPHTESTRPTVLWRAPWRAAVRERARLARPHPGARGARRTVHGGQRRGRNPPHLPQASPASDGRKAPPSDRKKGPPQIKEGPPPVPARGTRPTGVGGVRAGSSRGGWIADLEPGRKVAHNVGGARFARQTAPAGGGGAGACGSSARAPVGGRVRETAQFRISHLGEHQALQALRDGARAVLVHPDRLDADSLHRVELTVDTVPRREHRPEAPAPEHTELPSPRALSRQPPPPLRRARPAPLRARRPRARARRRRPGAKIPRVRDRKLPRPRRHKSRHSVRVKVDTP